MAYASITVICSGINEFGVSLGYKVIALPAAHYDEENKCLKGGHKPAPSATEICEGDLSSVPYPPRPPP